jgi:hypothetical protein
MNPWFILIEGEGVKGAAWLLLLTSIYMWLCINYITRELAMAGSLDLYHHLITELHQ